MSDKPKIYGTCDAGCLWETVHKGDFLEFKSQVEEGHKELQNELKNGLETVATKVKIDMIADNTFYLDIAKTYKLRRTTYMHAWGFIVKVVVYFQTTTEDVTTDVSAWVTLSLPLPEWDEYTATSYDEYLKLQIIEAYGRRHEDGSYHIYVVARCNDVIHHIETTYLSSTDRITLLYDPVIVEYTDEIQQGEPECYLINE